MITLDTERTTGKYGYYNSWITFADDNIMLFFPSGDETSRIESLSTDELKSEIAEVMAAFFPQPYEGFDFRPDNVLVSQWSSKPNFRGSYYYQKVGRTFDFEDLQAPLNGSTDPDDPNTLFFAGESFNDFYWGTVDSALMSGEVVAYRMLGKIPKRYYN